MAYANNLTFATVKVRNFINFVISNQRLATMTQIQNALLMVRMAVTQHQSIAQRNAMLWFEGGFLMSLFEQMQIGV